MVRRTSLGSFAVLVALVLALAVGLTGCSSSSEEEVVADPAQPFIGTWALYEGNVVQGSVAWYAHFKSDATFFISDNADGTRVRVSGTYTVSNGLLVGPFTNPGVGEGRVEATIANNVLDLDFIEYWHTPNKVVPYAGTKI